MRELTNAEIERVAGGFAERNGADDDVTISRPTVRTNPDATTNGSASGSTGNVDFAFDLGAGQQITDVKHDENGTEIDYKDGSSVFVGDNGNPVYTDSHGSSMVVTPTGNVTYDSHGDEMTRDGSPNIPQTLTVADGSGMFSFDLAANHTVTSLDKAADGGVTLHYLDGSSASVDANGVQTYVDAHGNAMKDGPSGPTFYDSDGNAIMGAGVPQDLSVGAADVSQTHADWIPNVAPQSTMHDSEGNTILVYTNPDQSINYYNLGTGIETDVMSNGQVQFSDHGQLYAATQGATTTWYDADGNPTGSTIANADGSTTVLDAGGNTQGTIYADGAATWRMDDGTVMNQSPDGQLSMTETIEVTGTAPPPIPTESADLNLALNFGASGDDAVGYGGVEGGGGGGGGYANDEFGDSYYRQDCDVA